MANSLKNQVFRRLLAAFTVSALVVVVATVWFQSRAEKKTVLSRQQSVSGNFQARIADLHREWEEQAAQLKQILEFTRILESRRPELLKAFFLTQSRDSDFTHAILLDSRGELLLQYGLEDEAREDILQVAKQEPWFFHQPQKTLYHLLKVPVWLGREGTGLLFLLKPVDNALLGHIVAPDTDLFLLFNGQPVSSSLGQSGLELFAKPDGKTSVEGARYTQVSIPWKDNHGRGTFSPTLIIRLKYQESLSRLEIALIVLVSLAILAATSRFVLGTWIGGIISAIVDLKTNSDSFARERILPLSASSQSSAEHRGRGDELGALQDGLAAMMQTVVESEQLFKAGEAALRREHDFSARLVDTAPVIILLLDTTGIIQYVNPFFERLAGYRRDEVQGRDWFDAFLPARDRDRIRALFQTATHEVPVRGNVNPIVLRNGEEREVEWNNQAVLDDQGNATALLLIGLDVSEMKRAEEKYRNILQTAIDGFWTTDPHGRLLEVNDAYCRMSGYSRDELLRMSVPDLEALEHPDETARHIARMIERGSERFMTKHRRKDGTLFDVEASVQYSSLQGGMFIAFVKDVTERKRVETALLESEERLRQAMDASHDGLWDWNLATGEVYYSPSYFRMLGYEPGELRGGAEIWMDRIHPDDRAGAVAANQECIDNRIRNFEVEFRMRSKSDNWVWILARGMAVRRDARGQALRMIGTHVDITAIKVAEEKIQAALAEKELLLREIHHRVKNNLQIVGSLLYLQAEQVAEPQALKLLQESRDRIRSMALVHEKLFGARDLSRVDMAGYLESLAGHLAHVYASGARAVRVEVAVREVTLGIDVAAPCGLIANELISNALKYAFPGGRPGTVRIAASRASDGEITLVVEDDGVGLPAGLDVARLQSLGLRLVHQLVGQLHGRMSLSSDGGTRFQISFSDSKDRSKEVADGA